MANVIKHKRGSGSDPGASDLVVGEVAIRTDTGKLFTKMDNGSIAEIAGGGSDIAINTLSSSSGTGGGSATFNGSAYRFTLSAPPSVSAYQLLVSINGVIQKPVAGTGQPSEGFSVDGNDIILGDAPATGSDFFILTFKSLGVSEPADNSVTTAKIVDNNVTEAKLALNSVTNNRVANGAITNAKIGNSAIDTAKLQDDAVTSAKIADGAIVNADINASAAIARTKLANVDVVDDTSPQLGGDLDTNSFEILLDDNHAVKFGDGADLQLYHSGTHSYIKNKTGNLYLMTTNTEYGAEFHADGAVKLNYDNVKKFETTSDGTLTSGAIRTNAATSGAASANQAVFDYNTSDTRILSYNSSGSSISLFTNPNGGSLASRLYIDSSGNVGIGTTSVDDLVHISTAENAAKGLRITNTNNSQASAIARVFISGGDNAKAALRLETNGQFHDIFERNTGELTIEDNGTERMRIDSSGRVGINQTSFATSDTMLSISELTGHLEVGLLSKNDSACVLNFGDPEDYNIGRLKYAHDDNSMRFDVNASERMRIDSSGDVGIGTSSASARLHVSRSNNHQTACIINNSGTAGGHGLKVTSGGTGSGTKIFNVCRDNTASEEEVFTILGGGEVGIGTSSPSYALELVTASGDTQMRIRTLGTGSGDDTIFRMQVAGTTQDNFIYFGDSDDGNVGQIRYNHNSDFMSFRANSSERMRISSNGDIGAPNGDNIYDASDERLKENMLELTDGLNKINKLKPISYNYKVGWNKDTEGKTKYGFGAQTTEKVDKLLVESFSDNDATLNGETIKNPLRVNEKFIIPLLVKAIQELTAKVEALEAK